MTGTGEVAHRGKGCVRMPALVKTKGRSIDTLWGVVPTRLAPVKLSLCQFEQRALIPSVLNLSQHVNAF